MAKYAEEIENMINVNFHGPGDNVPEETRHTILLYHHVSTSVTLLIVHCSLSDSLYLVCYRRHKTASSISSQRKAREARPSR